MLSYCLKCRQNTKRKNPKVGSTKIRRIMLLSKCEKVKNQNLSTSKKLSGLLNSLRIKAPLRKIPLIAPLLFQPFACPGRIYTFSLYLARNHCTCI